ncbi:MAG: HAMP domain-containing histidine kinase [Myxococcales bacterium]|nr:HAMP domain-containing histidine kinase [Myxococcales bacterium]
MRTAERTEPDLEEPALEGAEPDSGSQLLTTPAPRSASRFVEQSEEHTIAIRSTLHDVGNVMTSLRISANTLRPPLDDRRLERLRQAVARIQQHFVEGDDDREKVGLLLQYVSRVVDELGGETLRQAERHRAVQRSVQHAAEIIHEQLRPDSPLGHTQETISLATLITEAQSISALDVLGGNLELEREDEPGLEVRVSRSDCIRILVNLMHNAINAVRKANQQVYRLRIRTYSARSGYAIASIEDNGIGIATEELQKVFALGFTTKADGCGLGLSQSVRVARQMGGRMWCESEGRGHGATFILELQKVSGRNATLGSNHDDH